MDAEEQLATTMGIVLMALVTSGALVRFTLYASWKAPLHRGAGTAHTAIACHAVGIVWSTCWCTKHATFKFKRLNGNRKCTCPDECNPVCAQSL